MKKQRWTVNAAGKGLMAVLCLFAINHCKGVESARLTDSPTAQTMTVAKVPATQQLSTRTSPLLCTDPTPCPESESKCDDGSCIPSEWICDGEYFDCPDKDDEDCPASFSLQVTAVCNGSSGRVAARLDRGQRHRYQVSVVAGDIIEARVYGGVGFDSLMKITNAAGQIVAYNDDARGSDAGLSWVATATDTATVWVSESVDEGFEGVERPARYTLHILRNGDPLTRNPRGCLLPNEYTDAPIVLLPASQVPAESNPMYCIGDCKDEPETCSGPSNCPEKEICNSSVNWKHAWCEGLCECVPACLCVSPDPFSNDCLQWEDQWDYSLCKGPNPSPYCN